ncbi:MAG: ornithine carbamoyltransferase [Thermoguttaceae bacterium]|nr:ornithine carbamoyltransferase [Thermoguttaceae bacterium]
MPRPRHLLTLAELSTTQIEHIFSITEDLKTKYQQGLREAILPGRVMAMLFEKPSLRTRVSFEAGMVNLGGGALFLGRESGFGHRESIADFGRVLSEYVDVIVVRANRHQTVVDLAEYCTCSVINGLTDFAHPCQAMADLFTLRELVGKLEGHTLAWIGDANNVARSLALGCGKLGVRMAMATPPGYRFDRESMAMLRKEAPKLDLVITDDPAEAVRDAVAVYTDVWTSMGQEAESEQRRRDFARYQVNAELMALTQKGAVFMHCLPAHRGEEVTDEVLDGPQSVVVQQAGNRMHVQKGILAWLLASKT